MGRRKKRRNKKPFSPTKGGDGGVLPRVSVKIGTDTNIARNANSRRAMTCVERDDWDTLVPTNDPYDRAHSTRDGLMLLPAGVTVRGVDKPAAGLDAKPRLYPKCYMRAAGYSFETAEEKLDDRRRALHGEAPQWVASRRTMKSYVEHALAHLESRIAAPEGANHRDQVRAAEAQRKLRKCIAPGDDRTDEERENDAVADKWASARGVNLSPGSDGESRD
jgi:hypothetical protein